MDGFVTSDLANTTTSSSAPVATPTRGIAVARKIPSASELREKMDVSRIRREEREESFRAIARVAIAHMTENLGEILQSAIEAAQRDRSSVTLACFYAFGFAEKGAKCDANGNLVYFSNPSMEVEKEKETETEKATEEEGSAAATPTPTAGKIPGLYLLDMVNPSREWHVKFTQMLDRHINDMAGGGNEYWTGHRWNRGRPGKSGFYEMFVSWGPKPAPMTASTPRPMGPPAKGPAPGPLTHRLPKSMDMSTHGGSQVAPPVIALNPAIMAGSAAGCLDDPEKIAQTPRTVGPNKSRGYQKPSPGTFKKSPQKKGAAAAAPAAAAPTEDAEAKAEI